jgi:hypothetical protein
MIHTKQQKKQIPTRTATPKYVGPGMLSGRKTEARSPEKADVKQIRNGNIFRFPKI